MLKLILLLFNAVWFYCIKYMELSLSLESEVFVDV